MDKQILTISMLVSGREETTEKSLQSLQPLREQIGAEIILTDTGCTPEYLKKIQGLADQVLSFTWCNDFAKARNVGLKAANSEWFMFIDDDEWFEDVTPIIKFFQSGEYKNYHQAVYIARNYSNFEGTAYSDEWVSRMIRVEEDTRFEGRVHEALVPTRGKCKRLEAFVHHFGYVFATEEARQKHFQRNLSILKKLAEEEPNNLKWALQLLKEYLSVKDMANLQRVAEQSLKLIANIDKWFINMYRGSFYLALLMVDVENAQTDKLWEDYKRFIADDRNPWNVRCALAGFMVYHLEDGEKEHLEDCAKEYFTSLSGFKAETRSEQEQIIAESIVFVQDFMTDKVVLDMCCKYGEFANENISVLVDNIQREVNGNGEFLSLPERVWELAQNGALPLEDILLELPFSQWMAQMMVLQKEGYNEKWAAIGESLASICTRNDIRYSYFDMVTETTKMQQMYILKENLETMNYEMMTQILSDFSQANLNYMGSVYTENAFEGDMEILSREEQAAVWITNGLSTNLSQWREKIQYFGNAAKVWPEMGEFVKRYIRFVGEEAMKQLLFKPVSRTPLRAVERISKVS